jgi:3-hydroxyacyl-CoA dehydrogenase/enoyl-CoA hydratase/3-hydroxybutyryl-CoA epimerase
LSWPSPAIAVIVGDSPKTQLGLPEILDRPVSRRRRQSQRLPRLIGVQAALMYHPSGQAVRARPKAAMLKADRSRSCRRADGAGSREAHGSRPTPTLPSQPWDVKGYKVPGGAGSMNPNFAQTFMGALPMMLKGRRSAT